MKTNLEALQSARIQHRALFRQMAANPVKWVFYLRADNTPLLLLHGAPEGEGLPVAVEHVQAKSEEQSANALAHFFDLRSR